MDETNTATSSATDRRALHHWFATHPDTKGGSTTSAPDRRHSISSVVVRSIWQGEHTAAVGSDVKSSAAIGALTDLLSWHAAAKTDGAKRDQVTLMAAGQSIEVVDAFRTLRDTNSGPTNIRLLVTKPGEGFTFDEDTRGAVDYDDSPSATYYARLLNNWRSQQPIGVVLELADQLSLPALRLYPMLSGSLNPPKWSVRLDGLEIGQISSAGGKLDVGRIGKNGDLSKVRSIWLQASPEGERSVTRSSTPGSISVADGVTLVKQFVALLSTHAGGALDHGQAEHALESRVLRGLVPIVVGGTELAPISVEPLVSRGSQFPTLWGGGGRSRPLDALLRDGNVPWAVELKVQTTGGSGSYLRHGLAQAVLYRHFIRSATAVHPWFESFGLDAKACRAVIAFPAGAAATAARVAELTELAKLFDVAVVELPPL